MQLLRICHSVFFVGYSLGFAYDIALLPCRWEGCVVSYYNAADIASFDSRAVH